MCRQKAATSVRAPVDGLHEGRRPAPARPLPLQNTTRTTLGCEFVACVARCRCCARSRCSARWPRRRRLRSPTTRAPRSRAAATAPALPWLRPRRGAPALSSLLQALQHQSRPRGGLAAYYPRRLRTDAGSRDAVVTAGTSARAIRAGTAGAATSRPSARRARASAPSRAAIPAMPWCAPLSGLAPFTAAQTPTYIVSISP